MSVQQKADRKMPIRYWRQTPGARGGRGREGAEMLASKYEAALGKDEANYQPLSPITFLERSALVYPAKPAIIDGERIITYADMWRRCRQGADALRKAGVGKDDTISVFSPNAVPGLEMNYAASMAGGGLNSINYPLHPKTRGFILENAARKKV